jgi:hypothetical protein
MENRNGISALAILEIMMVTSGQASRSATTAQWLVVVAADSP